MGWDIEGWHQATGESKKPHRPSAPRGLSQDTLNVDSGRPCIRIFYTIFSFLQVSLVLRLTLQGEEGCYTIDVIVVQPISKTWDLQLRVMCVTCQVCPLVGTANDICFLDGFSQNAGGSPGQLTHVTLSSLGKQCLGCRWAVGVWRCLTDCHPEPGLPTLK